ncbi:hypothetical protein TTHERM_00095400 (macronuclear) [Tetrahymena thermophila SB210]|uniref:Uncharacterized protein n=1 Tax=Tetrahymena thermophila (strain SB210) TaxID=312017 RepID=Q235A7_TETTS|nr:hypothetical protein TTHERM_00095400 [Tetrahymena thermophila SB210]EAR91846.1 hypothetical protein TTHERM_00095400 [Tetrahymena thermophila SB210]|eukprot:XP_001012091.1 hypothetical protein TTHERM_00095400 [Tetrahymena thermophila SB210]
MKEEIEVNFFNTQQKIKQSQEKKRREGEELRKNYEQFRQVNIQSVEPFQESNSFVSSVHNLAIQTNI